MPEGFQTQLSETANKQRREGAPLLEAFLDANGRLAFRFVGEGGAPVAQPRVTTPGFVPPSLGITPPASTTPSTGITPQASGVATGSAAVQAGGGMGTPDDVFDIPGLQTAPASRTALGAIGMVPGFGLATGFTAAMQAAGFRGVVGGPAKPMVGTQTFKDVVSLGRTGRAGFVNQTVPDPTGAISGALATDTAAGEPEFSTALSMADLDRMSNSGSEGGDRAGRDDDSGGDRVGSAGASFGGGSQGPF